MKKDTSKTLSLQGFTLIELLVSFSVMITLTGILLYRYPETTMRLTLANANQSTALLVREAQARGSAIDSAGSTIGGYGVHFDIASTSQITFFSDLVDSGIIMPNGIPVGDGLYQRSSLADETKTTTFLPRGYRITKLCVGTGYPFTCGSDNIPPITSLTISFTRPNPQPGIYINDTNITNFPGACIELRSVRAPEVGHIRSIHIFNSGMIRTPSGDDNNGACDTAR